MPTLTQLQEQLAEDKLLVDKDECSTAVNATKARICMLNTYTPEALASIAEKTSDLINDDDLMEACKTLIATIAAGGQKKAMAQLVRWSIYYRDVSKMSRAQLKEFKQLVNDTTSGDGDQ
jgi:hypothetical protein